MLKSTTSAFILYAVLQAAGAETKISQSVKDPIEKQSLPDLIVLGNETVTISSRTHQYKSIYIKKGGTLIIQPGSPQWTILWATSGVTIDGVIIARKCPQTSSTLTTITPDGKVVVHNYTALGVGGRGGGGGAASQLGAGNRAGGAGQTGNTSSGGGGGSGGGMNIQGDASRLGSIGNSASDWQGAPPATDGGYGNRGGDGGRLNNRSNGCPVLIFSGDTLGGSGTIDLRGENGPDGTAGGDGVESIKGYRGGGGGGGGAPGGEGGHLMLVAKEIGAEPHVLLEGGFGGKGGAPGRYSRTAEKGADGDDGASGYMDVLLLPQWQSQNQPIKP